LSLSSERFFNYLFIEQLHKISITIVFFGLNDSHLICLILLKYFVINTLMIQLKKYPHYCLKATVTRMEGGESNNRGTRARSRVYRASKWDEALQD